MALLAAVFLPFLAAVLPTIAGGIKAFVDMLKDFFADPGEFIAKLGAGIADAMGSVLGTLIEMIAKAFNEIPILKTLADFFERTMVTISSLIDSIFGFFTTAIDSLAKLVASAIGLPTAIINGLTNVFKAIFDNITKSLELIGAVVLLIASVVGTAILTSIIKVLASVSWIETFFKSGGFSFSKEDRVQAAKQADAAYDRTVGAYVTLTKSFADNMKEGEARKSAQAITQAVETQLTGKTASATASTGSSSQASSTTVNNQSTTINSNPGFYGIPIYGGGF
jgi:phage-related protein